MAINKFQKGSGVYTCECCGIQTRVTGDRSAADLKLCNECYELAGYENMLQDGEELSPSQLADIERMLAVITKKGGNTEKAFDKSLLPSA